MNTRKPSYIIIGLCILSIIIGIINTAIVPAKEEETVKQNKKSSFFNGVMTPDRIAVINLEGAISSESSKGLFDGQNSAENVKKSIDKAIEDASVKGVILRINSPGGTVAMSHEIYQAVMRLRKEKPVVVSMLDLAASGGYYIACAADRIYANPGTLTGSIGVIMSSLNYQGLLNNKLGIQSVVIKSGKFKDIASPYRPLTSEERTLLQNMINNTYKQFVHAIIQGRVKRTDKYTIKMSPLTEANLKKYADGRIFTGEEAKKLGFVDQLGGLYEAEIGVNKMAKEKFNLSGEKLPTVQYNKPSNIEEFFSGMSESIMPGKDITKAVMPLTMKFPNQPLFVWE